MLFIRRAHNTEHPSRGHQGSVPSPLSAVVVDVVTEFASEGVLGELLYADELFMMSETMEGLSNKFLEWRLLRARI